MLFNLDGWSPRPDCRDKVSTGLTVDSEDCTALIASVRLSLVFSVCICLCRASDNGEITQNYSAELLPDHP